jgi:hypothetical protein
MAQQWGVADAGVLPRQGAMLCVVQQERHAVVLGLISKALKCRMLKFD